ncbi:MAG: ABC transporter permease, partial [Chloroflexota bacterium]
PDSLNRFDLVINHNLLNNESDIQLGDIIMLQHEGEEQQWRVVGILWGSATVGGPSVLAYSYYDSVAHFTGRIGQTNQIGVATGNESSDVLAELERTGLDVLDFYSVEVASSDILPEQLQSAVSSLDIIFVLLIVSAILIAIVGGLGLSGTMSLSVLERTREIGILRSVGASTTLLRSMFMAEGAFIGLLSGFIAILLSFATTGLFGTALGMAIRGRPWTYTLTISGPLYWLIIVMVVSVFASVLPAQRAAQISIREAISYE